MIIFLTISLLMFIFGLCGIFLTSKNLITVLLSIEILLLSVNLNFIIFSIYLDDLLGQIYALLIITVAAAESAIGLAILVIYYRKYNNIDINKINKLKG